MLHGCSMSEELDGCLLLRWETETGSKGLEGEKTLKKNLPWTAGPKCSPMYQVGRRKFLRNNKIETRFESIFFSSCCGKYDVNGFFTKQENKWFVKRESETHTVFLSFLKKMVGSWGQVKSRRWVRVDPGIMGR